MFHGPEYSIYSLNVCQIKRGKIKRLAKYKISKDLNNFNKEQDF